jgi:hypothetical protein
MHNKLTIALIGLTLLLGGGMTEADESKANSQPVKAQKPALLKAIENKGTADEYVLVMSKDDNVCLHMLKLYNSDLKKYEQVRYKRHKEFNWIKWVDKGIRLKPASEPTHVMGISARIAVFDINNDFKDEVILYSPSMLV